MSGFYPHFLKYTHMGVSGLPGFEVCRSLAPQTGENSTSCLWEQELSTEPGLDGTASPRNSLQKGINAEGGCALNRRNIAE